MTTWEIIAADYPYLKVSLNPDGEVMALARKTLQEPFWGAVGKTEEEALTNLLDLLTRPQAPQPKMTQMGKMLQSIAGGPA